MAARESAGPSAQMAAEVQKVVGTTEPGMSVLALALMKAGLAKDPKAAAKAEAAKREAEEKEAAQAAKAAAAAEKAAAEAAVKAEAEARAAAEAKAVAAAEAAAKAEADAKAAAEAKAKAAAEAAAKAEADAKAAAEAKAAPPSPPPAAAPAPAKAAAEPAKAAAAPAAAAADGAGPSAALVKELRTKTSAGMMDCKKALIECNNNLEEAADWLRKKGLVTAGKKAGRIAAEGAVGSYIHTGGRIGVLLEMNCETDFVARGERFQGLMRDMAMQVAACPDVLVVSTEDVDEEWKAKETAIESLKEDLLDKPEARRPQIVAGRITKRVNEVSLLEQPFIKDTEKKVSDVLKAAVAEIGENIKIRRFVRFNLGEGLEKKSEDFAAEVAAASAVKAKPAEPAAAAAAPPPPKVEVSADKSGVVVSAKAVSELRAKTSAGMMDCKKALQQCDNNLEEAADWLRKKGLVTAGKKAGRIAAEGAVGSYIHTGGRIGVLLEMNCETDFVARGERFQGLMRDMAMQVAACPDVLVVSTEDVDEEWKAKETAIESLKEDLLDKPEARRPQIVAGRITKRVNEVSLLEQPFIKDTEKKVSDVLKAAVAEIGENIKIRRFFRFNLGEGLEKKSEDFAAEVAAASAAVKK